MTIKRFVFSLFVYHLTPRRCRFEGSSSRKLMASSGSTRARVRDAKADDRNPAEVRSRWIYLQEVDAWADAARKITDTAR